MKSPSQEISAVTAALSACMAGAARKRVPLEIAARARLHLVDTFTAMISGSCLIVPVLGNVRSQALLGALWKFDQLRDMWALRRFYAK